jgi:prolyl-tRNA synthetase
MDLIGLPWQLVVGPRGAKAGTVEVKERKGGAKMEMSIEATLNRLAGA